MKRSKCNLKENDFLLPGEKNTYLYVWKKNCDCSSKLVHARIHLFCPVFFSTMQLSGSPTFSKFKNKIIKLLANSKLLDLYIQVQKNKIFFIPRILMLNYSEYGFTK